MGRRFHTALIFAFIISISVSTVFANGTSLESLASFEITSGLPKEIESTFDDSRTIIGIAEKNTNVTVSVSHAADGEEEPEVTDYFEITVGASGMFSQSIHLQMGENTVVVTAAKGKYQSEKVALIKRKDKEIKLELEQGLALPGQNIR